MKTFRLSVPALRHIRSTSPDVHHFVMLVAVYYNEETGRCDVGLRALTELCHRSRETLKTLREQAVANGDIEVEPSRGRRPTNYRLLYYDRYRADLVAVDSSVVAVIPQVCGSPPDAKRAQQGITRKQGNRDSVAAPPSLRKNGQPDRTGFLGYLHSAYAKSTGAKKCPVGGPDLGIIDKLTEAYDRTQLERMIDSAAGARWWVDEWPTDESAVAKLWRYREDAFSTAQKRTAEAKAEKHRRWLKTPDGQRAEFERSASDQRDALERTIESSKHNRKRDGKPPYDEAKYAEYRAELEQDLATQRKKLERELKATAGSRGK